MRMLAIAGVLLCAAAWGASGAPKLERIAIAADRDYLDGPAKEAFLMMHKGCALDEEGNIFVKPAVGLGSIRCIRTDGQMVTITGGDRWCGNLGLDEGPAAFMPDLCGAVGTKGGYGGAGGGWFNVSGAPWKGEEHGCLYAGIGGYPHKIFKNKEKNGRWWFKRIGTGDKPLPTTVGGAVKIDGVNLLGVTFSGAQFAHKGNLYRVDSAKGEIACVLAAADYGEHVPSMKKAGRMNVGDSMGPAEGAGMAPDGTMFIKYYKTSYPHGRIFRVSPDRSKVEEIVRSTGKGVRNQDGSGINTRWHCGPNGFVPYAGDCILVNAIDSNRVRRWMGGRTAHLCNDGEWREQGPTQNVYGSSVRGKGWLLGKTGGKDFIFIYYPGEENQGASGIFRFGPIDMTKPTVGTPAE